MLLNSDTGLFVEEYDFVGSIFQREEISKPFEALALKLVLLKQTDQYRSAERGNAEIVAQLVDLVEAAIVVGRKQALAVRDDADTDEQRWVERVNDRIREVIAGSECVDAHPKHQPHVRRAVWNITGGRCVYCGVEVQRDTGVHALSFVVEHVVPQVAGGPNHLTNYVPACHACNSSKRHRHPIEFVKALLIQHWKQSGARRP